MAGLTVEIETKQVTDALTEMVKKLEHPKSLLKIIADYLEASTKKMFRGPRPDHQEVDGIKWPELAEGTINQKKSQGYPLRPMVRTGEGRDSIEVLELSENRLVYGTKITTDKGFPYMAHHNSNRFPWLFLNAKRYNEILTLTIGWLKDQKKKIE